MSYIPFTFHELCGIYNQFVNINLHTSLYSQIIKSDPSIRRLHRPRLKSARIFSTPTALQIPRSVLTLCWAATYTQVKCIQSSGCKSGIKTKSNSTVQKNLLLNLTFISSITVAIFQVLNSHIWQWLPCGTVRVYSKHFSLRSIIPQWSFQGFLGVRMTGKLSRQGFSTRPFPWHFEILRVCACKRAL